MNLNATNNINIKQLKKSFLNKVVRIFDVKEKEEVLSTNLQDETQELVENIRNAKREWINANINFDYADDQEIVDYFIYKIKACQVKYEYYIKKAKERGIKLDSLNSLDTMNKRSVNY